MNPASKEKQNEIWDTILNYENSRFVQLIVEHDISLALTGRDETSKGIYRLVDILGLHVRRYHKEEPRFCITIIENAKDLNTIKILAAECSQFIVKENIREWIITDGIRYWFIPTNKHQELESLTLDDSISRLSKIFKNEVVFKPQDLWSKILSTLKIKFNNQYESIITKLEQLNISDQDFTSDNYSIFLKPDIERLILQYLLSQNLNINQKGVLYRYISQNALERLLIENQISMSGLAGMNDISELNTLNIFQQKSYEFKYEESILSNIIKQENEYFINSFGSCNKSDDLTMWRLYGDDGKGACLIFEYDIEMLNKEGFYLLPVTYIDNNISDNIRIIDLLCGKLKFYNRYFVLKNIDIWEHYIKSIDFADEQEIRLLFKYNSNLDSSKINRRCTHQWIRNKSNGIFHPIINFNTQSYPLKLKSIILGPKFPELTTNLSQINYLAKQIDERVLIKKSKCRFYR